MDQYPYREDAAGAISESINWLKKFDTMVNANCPALQETISVGDAVATSSLLCSIIN